MFMRFPFLVSLFCLAAGLSLQAAPHKGMPEPPEGFVALFDGRTLDGWFTSAPNTQKIWSADAEAGVLGREIKHGYIWTEGLFEDFVLMLEFKMSYNCNSGVFFRTDPANPVQGGFEIQILDTPREKQPGKHDIGALYDAQAASANTLRDRGEWNSMKLHVEGDRIRVWINGRMVNDVDLGQWKTPEKNPDGSKNKFKTALNALPKIGHIGFQDHGHNVYYRNIFLKKL